MELKRDALLMKLGAAKQQAPSAWRFVEVELPSAKKKKKQTSKNEPEIPEKEFSFKLHKDKLRVARRREGRYLLRSNMPERPPEQLWQFYLQLVQVEQAFKHLKSDLALRPIYHKKEARIEAHIFVAFLAYCLHVTLGRRLRDLAPGLTPRSVLEKLAAMQMIDVHLPTTDQREVILTRYTQPEPEQRLLLEKLKLKLPEQPPPKITARQVEASKPV
jgi:transposase